MDLQEYKIKNEKEEKDITKRKKCSEYQDIKMEKIKLQKENIKTIQQTEKLQGKKIKKENKSCNIRKNNVLKKLHFIIGYCKSKMAAKVPCVGKAKGNWE